MRHPNPVRMSRVAAVALLAIGLVPQAAHASSTIVCTPPSGRAPVVITQGELTAFGASLTCIRGLDTEGQHPCAPANGYGLQGPTGAAGLGGITFRWQDLLDHLGPVVGHQISGSEMSFEGGFAGGSGGYTQRWRFTIDRVSGAARLRTIDGRKTGTADYRCERRQRAL